MRIAKIDPDTEWVEQRKAYIGASEICAAMGLSKYKSRKKLYLEKKGLVPGFKGNRKTEIGKVLEGTFKIWFEQKTLLSLRRKNCFCIHDDYPWMSCSLDFHIVSSGTPVEMKTTSLSDWDENNVPAEYFWQCQQQMLITGHKTMFLCVYHFNSGNFKIHVVDLDPDACKSLIALGSEFWECVVEGIEPDFAWNDDTDTLPGAVIGKTTVIESPGIINAGKRYIEITDMIKTLEEEKGRISSELKNSLGDSNIGLADRIKIQWNRGGETTKQIFNLERFQKENPEMFLKYNEKTPVKSNQHFRVTQII
jgi:putative phage-type endonuclease